MFRQMACPNFVTRIVRLTVTAILLYSPIATYAQDASQRPPHAGEVVSALQGARWEVLPNGLRVLEVDTALGTRITAISFDLDTHRLQIVPQVRPTGERVSQVLRRLDPAMVVNGGFFSMATDQILKPVGRLIIDGEALSAAWSQSGGFLALDADGKPSITLSAAGDPAGAVNAIQSKPVLIEPGGRWAMNTNGTELARRTLFCLKADNTALFVIVHGNGLSLFEAGWVLRSRAWGGYFNCDSAIALDGGGSTQLAVKEHGELAITGLTPVQNSIAVFEKGRKSD